MTSTADRDAPDATVDAGRLLAAWAEPARRSFLTSAAAEAAGTVALIGQWAGCAMLIAALMDDPSGAGVRWAVGVTVAAAVARVALTWPARRAAEHGADTVARRLRSATLSAVVPDGARHAAVGSTTAATHLLDTTRTVADYAATSTPLRYAAPVSMGAILIAVAAVHWPVALILLACTALLPLNMKLAGLVALDEGRAQLRGLERFEAFVLESVRAATALRGLGAIGRRRRELESVSTAWAAATERVLRRAFLSALVFDVAVTFAIAVCATYVGLVLLDYLHLPWVPEIDLARGLFVLLLCPAYFTPVQRAAAGFHARDDALVAAEALAESVPELDTAKHLEPDVPQRVVSASSAPPEVRLDDVTVRFGDRAVLDRVDLEVPAGRWTALTGPSGAGKTTVLRLIAGVAAPDSGTVRWDGADRPVAHAWLGARTVVLDGTLSTNVAIAEPGASRERIEAAARAAGLADVIDRIGLDGRVGDRGAGLSAGEARRLALARIILADRPLWILDEPTAHLDADTEARVLDAIVAAADGRTVVVATHSPVVADRADAVLTVFDGGLDEEVLR